MIQVDGVLVQGLLVGTTQPIQLKVDGIGPHFRLMSVTNFKISMLQISRPDKARGVLGKGFRRLKTKESQIKLASV